MRDGDSFHSVPEAHTVRVRASASRRFHIACGLLALIIPVLSVASPAVADDESAGVMPGRLRAEAPGALSGGAVHVALSGDRVEVAASVVVRAERAGMHLDMPRFGWLGEAETYPDRQFPELAVAIDGRAATLRDRFDARFRGRDMTVLVRAAGVDPYVIADTPPFVQVPDGRQAAVDALLAAGAVTRAPEGLIARWTVQRRIGLVLRRGRHRVTLRYKARPGFVLSDVPLLPGTARWTDYCLTESTATVLFRRASSGGAVVLRNYAIPVGVGGVRTGSVHLTVDRRTPRSTVIVCSAAGTALIDPPAGQPVKAGPDGALHMLSIGRVSAS